MARRLETLFVRYRRRGDVAALGRIFDRTAPELIRLAMHFSRHPGEAEDLLQETFLTAIARADRYDPDRPLVPWLVGILRNHAHRLHRERRRSLRALDASEASGGDDDSWMDVAWSDAVAAAVAALPEPYRQVLVLRLQHDRSPAEIAVLLDLPPATVRSQIHRGLDRLRRRLPPDARTHALAALPIGMGLGGLRSRVLSRAARAVGGSAATTAALPFLGGLLMTKKTVAGAGLLLAVLLAAGSAWLGGVFERGEERAPASLATTLAEESAARAGAPGLVGAGAPPAVPDADAQTDSVVPAAAAVWPPRADIPEDKGSVAGTVRFEDGTPLVGAPLALWGSPSIVSITDAHGRYHVHADWVHQRSLFLRLGREDQPDWLGLILSSDVVMRGGTLVMRDVTIRRGIALQALIRDARSDELLEDVDVVLRRKPLGHGQASSGFARTDAQGRFEFPYVPRGVYTLELKAAGYEAKVTEYDLTFADLPDELTLAPSRSLIIRLENLPEGAAGTQVTCDLSRMDQTAFSVMTKRVIGSDGTLTLDAPEPGTYRLTLYKSSHLPRLERDLVVPQGPLEAVVWTLRRGSRVTGTIRDAGGEPIPGAQVQIDGAAGRPRTDAAGAFTFAYVPAGKRAAKLRAGTAWLRLAEVEVPEGGTARVDLQVPGSATLTGRFLVGGVPVPWTSGRLEFRDLATDKEVATSRPDAKGGFRVPHLAAGRYEIYAWCGTGVARALTVEVARGEVKDVGAIDLEPLLRVAVRFVLPAGRALPSIWVQAFDAAHPPPARVPSVTEAGGRKMMVSPYVQTDDEGRTWVAGLPRGRHRLEFLAEGFEQATVEVEAGAAEADPVEVRLELKAAGR